MLIKWCKISSFFYSNILLLCNPLLLNKFQNESQIAVQDRMAFACLYLDDKKVSFCASYLQYFIFNYFYLSILTKIVVIIQYKFRIVCLVFLYRTFYRKTAFSVIILCFIFAYRIEKLFIRCHWLILQFHNFKLMTAV